jgi:biotin carboxyl carrier protein
MTYPKVFISYSHDSEEHREAVLQLAQRLRSDGIDAWIDRFEAAPPQGWARWMRQRIRSSNFVIIVCTEPYMKRFEGQYESSGQGLGASWEGLILTAELYQAYGKTMRLVPVVMKPSDRKWIPDVLSTHQYHQLPEGYAGLYRALTDQPEVLPAELGAQRVKMPAVTPQWTDTPSQDAEPDVEVTAWFDGTLYHCAVLMTRARADEPWYMEVMSSLPLHQDLRDIPKGMALVNLVKDGQYVGSLMALRPLQVLFLADHGSEVKAGQKIAVVRGPAGEPLVAWNQIRNTFGPYMQHAPPLGFRVWTQWRGTPEQCIRIDHAKLIEEGQPTRLSICLKPMRVPPELFEVRSPISGILKLPQPFPVKLSKAQHLCTISGARLKIDLSCSQGGQLLDLRVADGERVEAGQVILVAVTGLVEVQAPIVGTFYSGPTPLAPPFVQVGDEVRRGQVLYVIEAMKLPHEIESDVAGRVVEILVQNAQPVEFGEPIMKIDCS